MRNGLARTSPTLVIVLTILFAVGALWAIGAYGFDLGTVGGEAPPLVIPSDPPG